MAVSKVTIKVNPPDILTLTKVASMTSGQYTDVVSNGAYYQGRAYTTSTASGCYVYLGIYNNGSTKLLSCAEAGGSGANVRVDTDLLYIPAGVKLHVTGGFNDTSNSGIYRADPIR